VKVVCLAHPAQTAQRTAQIHVIPGDQQATTCPSESRDSPAIFGGQAVPFVNRKQPQLVERGFVETRKNRVRLPEPIAVPSDDIERHASFGISSSPQ
jgi:hypothetical protein